MKELEVKSMLSDPSIPDSYKLGGRLDERFLAGVEYAEAAFEKMMKKAPTLWAAKNAGEPFNRGLAHVFMSKPKLDKRMGVYGQYEGTIDRDGYIPYNDITLWHKSIPGLTFENSPKKVRLILEDEE